MAEGIYLTEAFAKISASADPLQFKEETDRAVKAIGDATVNMKLGTDEAKRKAADLRETLKRLVGETTAHIKVDDADGRLKLATFAAAADRLHHKLENEKISLSGVDRASLDLLRLEVQADRLKAKLGEENVGGLSGLVERLFGGGGGAGGAGGAGEAASSGLLPEGGGAATVGALAVPAIGAALVEVTGLVSGLAAAGLGVGAFGALAIPVFEKVSAAMSLSPKALAKQPAMIREIVGGIQGLTREFGKLSAAMAPADMKVFDDALKIAANLLPDLMPFAKVAAPAIEGLLNQAARFTASKGFKDWLSQMASVSGPAITAIGQGLGKVTVAIGNLFTIMSKKDIVNAINIAFTVLADTIDLLGGAVKLTMAWYDRLVNKWDSVDSAAKHTSRDIWTAWDASFAAVRGFVARAETDFDIFRSRTASTFSGIKADVRSVWDSTWSETIGRTESGVTAVTAWFHALPGDVLRSLSGLGDDLNSDAKNWLHLMLEGAESVWDNVRSWFAGLPSQILHALGIHSPPDWAISAGKHIMTGLIQGVTGSSGSLQSIFSGLAGDVTGPLSSVWNKLFSSGGGGVGAGRWLPVVLEALKLARLPAGLANQVLHQISTESGGNPTAVNRTDINAQEGHPSVGLLQVIQGTFDRFAGPFLHTGPFEYGVSTNPLANVFSAIEYARAVYGSTLMSDGSGLGSGHGYALGTMSAAPGWAKVGEFGPELVNFGGGEMVLPNAAQRYRPAGVATQTASTTPTRAEITMISLLRQLVNVTSAAPSSTGNAVAGALNGVGGRAVTRALYPNQAGAYR